MAPTVLAIGMSGFDAQTRIDVEAQAAQVGVVIALELGAHPPLGGQT